MKKHLAIYCLCIAMAYTGTAQTATQKVYNKSCPAYI
jgi:hypothetical protein